MADLRVDIQPSHLELVRTILRQHLPQSAKVWAFGSRARGDNREASDLDLAIDLGRALTLGEMAALCAGFEESTLPYKVDIVDMHQISAAFREIVAENQEEILFCSKLKYAGRC